MSARLKVSGRVGGRSQRRDPAEVRGGPHLIPQQADQTHERDKNAEKSQRTIWADGSMRDIPAHCRDRRLDGKSSRALPGSRVRREISLRTTWVEGSMGDCPACCSG